MAMSLLVPVGYITFLVVSLTLFSRIYRHRRSSKLASSHKPWFPEGHKPRDTYITLLSISDPPTPDVVLKSALLCRAMEDVRRIMRLRDDKQALSVLLQKGSIGDEALQRIQVAEKELEAEILEVIAEANTFREGWGQIIFQTAAEMVNHLKHKELYYKIKQERDEYEKRLIAAGVSYPPLFQLPPGPLPLSR